MLLIPMLLSGCADWVFKSINVECSNVDQIEIIAFDNLQLRFPTMPESVVPSFNEENDIEFSDQCSVYAYHPVVAPTIYSNDTSLFVEGPQEVDVYGQKSLIVDWPEPTWTTLRFDFGTITGRGPGYVDLDQSGDGRRITIDCPGCTAELDLRTGFDEVSLVAIQSAVICAPRWPDDSSLVYTNLREDPVLWWSMNPGDHPPSQLLQNGQSFPSEQVPSRCSG